MNYRYSVKITFMFLFLLSSVVFSDTRYGIVNKKAPSWEIDIWANLTNSKLKIDIKDYKGKVLFIYGFQSW